MSGEKLDEFDLFSEEVTVPKPHEFVTAASVRLIAMALANRTQRLIRHAALDTTAATGTANTQNFIFVNDVLITGSESKLRSELLTELLGSIVIDGNAELRSTRILDILGGALLRINSQGAMSAPVGSQVHLQGRVTRSAPVVLTDADQTIDCTQGNIFYLPDSPASSRTITLRRTAASGQPLTAPMAGDWIRVIRLENANSRDYLMQNEGSGASAAVLKGTISIASVPQTVVTMAEFQYVTAVSRWRLVGSSGIGIQRGTDS